jgi:hypothetical protein
VGARVAAYWSAKYQFLHPGTVVPHEGEGGGRNSSKYVNIELDDGDSREIHVDQVRFVYDRKSVHGVVRPERFSPDIRIVLSEVFRILYPKTRPVKSLTDFLSTYINRTAVRFVKYL